MKRAWVIIIVIAVLVGGAIAFVLLSDSDMSSSFRQETSNNSEQPGSSQPATPPSGVSEGQYLDYSADTVATTEGRKWLFFHAPWCPQCRALESDINSQGVPDGVTIFKVDYDTSTQLKQKYGVTLQTTIVEVDDNGNEIAKFVAYDDPSVDAVVNALGE